MLSNIFGDVLDYASQFKDLKSRIRRANGSAIDDIIGLLAKAGFNRPKILEILTDLMGSAREAQVWCERSDLLGNDRWWAWLSDLEAETEAPWLRWGSATQH